MNNKETIQEFMAQIDKIEDELVALSDNREDTDEDKVLILLQSLLEGYDIAVIFIGGSGEAEDYNNITVSLMNEEPRLQKKIGDSSNKKVLYANTNTKGKKFQNKNKYNRSCDFCGIHSCKEQECKEK
jgi:hypothetical protein